MARSKITPVQLYNPYKFSVYRNAALTIATDTVIIFDTKSFDTGTNVSTSTGLFTAPVAGFYQIQALISSSSTVTSYYMAEIYKNGSLWKYGEANSLATPQSGVADLMQLAAGDTVGIAVHAGSSPVLNVGPTFSYFSGFLVSTT